MLRDRGVGQLQSRKTSRLKVEMRAGSLGREYVPNGELGATFVYLHDIRRIP